MGITKCFFLPALQNLFWRLNVCTEGFLLQFHELGENTWNKYEAKCKTLSPNWLFFYSTSLEVFPQALERPFWSLIRITKSLFSPPQLPRGWCCWQTWTIPCWCCSWSSGWSCCQCRLDCWSRAQWQICGSQSETEVRIKRYYLARPSSYK